LLAVLVFLISFFGHIAIETRMFNKSKPDHDNQNCKLIRGADGIEDFQIVNNLLFGSSDDFKWMHDGNIFSGVSERQNIASSKTQGAIFLFNLSSDNPVMEKLEMEGFLHKDFHPHGIHVVPLPNDDVLLFAVNHRRDADSIELFRFSVEHKKLIYIQSFTHSLFNNLNDLAAFVTESKQGVSEVGFYVSNWMYYDAGTGLNLVELLTKRKWSDVILCTANFWSDSDGFISDSRSSALQFFTCNVAIPNGFTVMANGMTITDDGKTVYLSAPGDEVLHVFSRDLKTNSLTSTNKIHLASHCDNPHLDKHGDVVMGCHPSPYLFLKHKATGEPAPTQVIRVSFKGDGSIEVRELLLSEGKDLAGSSIAAIYELPSSSTSSWHLKNKSTNSNSKSNSNSNSKEMIIIGAVFDHGLLVCPLKSHNQGIVLFETL